MIISFVACPSVCTELGSHQMDFHEIWYVSIFQISVMKIQVSVISDKNNGYFTWRPVYICNHNSLSSSPEWETFRTIVVEKNETHILCVFCFSKLCHSWDNVDIHSGAGEAKDDNMGHTHFTLGTYGYKHTLLERVIFIAFLLLQWLHKCTWNINQDRQCTLNLHYLS